MLQFKRTSNSHKNHKQSHLMHIYMTALSPPAPRVTVLKAEPKIPAPKAPADCRYENTDPALAKPIIDWIHAAKDPAPIPPLVKPSPPKKLALPAPAADIEANKLAKEVYPRTLRAHSIKVSFFGVNPNSNLTISLLSLYWCLFFLENEGYSGLSISFTFTYVYFISSELVFSCFSFYVALLFLHSESETISKRMNSSEINFISFN